MNAAANDRMIDTLKDILGPGAVITDETERAFYSTDVYSAPPAPCAAVIQPDDVATLAKAIGAATQAGYAVVGRGGGMSYTNGYAPKRADTITVDVASLNKIIEISAEGMYITVQAGVTWKQIYDALNPLGLRLPFFGTFSGIKATVGGGLSQGALFMGTARYGQGADIVLGLEVVLADGVRLNHPAKPLTIAQTLFNSAADGVTYEAQVVLTFNAPGRTGMVEKLELLREQAGTDIRPAAQFDKPSAA